jgi:hypothetical protein
MVAVDVARARDAPAEGIAGRGALEAVQQLAGAARVEVDVAGAVAGGADEDVVDVVVVGVARVGHREAVLVAGRPVKAVDQAAGATRVDVGRPGRRVGPVGRLADDRLLDAVVVDVAELADRPAEVRAPRRGAVRVELVQHADVGLHERPARPRRPDRERRRQHAEARERERNRFHLGDHLDLPDAGFRPT